MMARFTARAVNHARSDAPPTVNWARCIAPGRGPGPHFRSFQLIVKRWLFRLPELAGT